MNDRGLYATLLGIQPPWTVSAVSVDGKASEVVVSVEAKTGGQNGKLWPS